MSNRISFKTAMLARKKGLKILTHNNGSYFEFKGKTIPKHTFAEIQDALRDNYSLCVYVDWQEMNAIICDYYPQTKRSIRTYKKCSCLPNVDMDQLLQEALELIK